MDAEQIRQEMRLTRASIDEKLDALAIRTSSAAKQGALRAGAAVATAIATLFGVWWWRHRSRHVRVTERLIS